MNTEKTRDSRQRRRNFGPLLLVLLILAIIAVIAIPLSFGRMMMDGNSSQTAQQFALASPDTTMSVMLQVNSLPTTTLLFEGTLLQKNGDGSYSRTTQRINVLWNPSQSVTMGSNSDLKVGAILQVHGTLGTQNVLTADQIIVLTGYVQVR